MPVKSLCLLRFVRSILAARCNDLARIVKPSRSIEVQEKKTDGFVKGCGPTLGRPLVTDLNNSTEFTGKFLQICSRSNGASSL